jgi:hypothetical protein
VLYESSMLEPTITVAAQQLCLKLAKHVRDIITDYEAGAGLNFNVGEKSPGFPVHARGVGWAASCRVRLSLRLAPTLAFSLNLLLGIARSPPRTDVIVQLDTRTCLQLSRGGLAAFQTATTTVSSELHAAISTRMWKEIGQFLPYRQTRIQGL